MKVFPDTSLLPLATLPTRVSQRRPLQCGKRRATPGSPYRLIHRQIAPKSRDRSFWAVPANYQLCLRPLWPLDLNRSADRVPPKKTHFFAWHVTGLPDRGPPPFGINDVITLFLQSIAECADATSPSIARSLLTHPRAAGGRLRSWLTVLRQVDHAIRANFLRRSDSERHDGRIAAILRSPFPISRTRDRNSGT